jgi:hypothetical protein
MKRYAAQGSIFAIAIIALIGAPAANSAFAKKSVEPQIKAHPARIPSLNCFPILADFDGDRRLDQVELHSVGAHECIRIRFGNSRERHINPGCALQLQDLLLARDINRDNRSDLIWVSHSRSDPTVFLLGDGLGNFVKPADTAAYEAELSSLLPGALDSELAADLKEEEQGFLPPDKVSPELPRAASLAAEIGTPLVFAINNPRRDLGLYLSYLRKRGPPPHPSLV